MFHFGIAIFLSSFLLFQVQPIIARYILPWFGGSPAVWTACMLFFQLTLLAGYAYAHLISARLAPRRQYLLHIALLLLSLAALPITPDSAWKLNEATHPTARILALLALSVGAPYLMVSSTAPLLQRWFSLARPAKSPYRLYALSNAASMLGLLSYPFLFEPNLGLQQQTTGWSYAYGAFILACVWSGRGMLRLSPAAVLRAKPEHSDPSRSGTGTWSTRLLWLLLSAAASVLLLAFTNHVSQNIAVVPFLWVLPLSLYLLSFVIAFDNDRWYARRLWLPLLGVFIAALCLHQVIGGLEDPLLLIPLYCAALFVFCMVCHGELARLRPAPDKLTGFYLTVAAGGAIGGVFVSLLAPLIFTRFWELPLGLAAALALTSWCLVRMPHHHGAPITRGWMAGGGAVLSVAMIMLAFGEAFTDRRGEVIEARRNFYGLLKIIEGRDEFDRLERTLYHGTIKHGSQFTDPSWQMRQVSYYSANSGVGLAIERHEKSQDASQSGEQRRLNVGVVGLGAGALAAAMVSGDQITFYEIDPDVIDIAQTQFTYLKNSPASTRIVPGDARIELERELAARGSQRYDILAVDAFSGDAIPVHLLTVEAVELYLSHLAEGGILAIHISNRMLELSPVIRGIGRSLDLQMAYISRRGSERSGTSDSSWVLLSRGVSFSGDRHIARAAGAWPEDFDHFDVVWTDDYSSLFRLLD